MKKNVKNLYDIYMKLSDEELNDIIKSDMYTAEAKEVAAGVLSSDRVLLAEEGTNDVLLDEEKIKVMREMSYELKKIKWLVILGELLFVLFLLYKVLFF